MSRPRAVRPCPESVLSDAHVDRAAIGALVDAPAPTRGAATPAGSASSPASLATDTSVSPSHVGFGGARPWVRPAPPPVPGGDPYYVHFAARLLAPSPE